jgi:hypothetical protein
MSWVVAFVIEELRSMTKPVSSDEDGKREIGELLAQATRAVGLDGIITVEEAKGICNKPSCC